MQCLLVLTFLWSLQNGRVFWQLAQGYPVDVVSIRTGWICPWTHAQFPAAFVMSVFHCEEVFVWLFVQADSEEASF